MVGVAVAVTTMLGTSTAMRSVSVFFACCCIASADEPRVSDAEKSKPPPMDELLQLYREFGLPLPPADAPLVKAPTGWSHQLASGKDVPILTLGFLLKPADGKNPAEVLIGPI